MISFITTIKICKNYEWLLDSIILYIKNIAYYCNKYEIPYEIIVVEQVNNQNLFLIGDKHDFSVYPNVHIVKLEQNYYNPFNHNLIESYGKNAGLNLAKGDYTCMTSADVLFAEQMFVFMKSNLEPEIFYRFPTYEVPRSSLVNKNAAIVDILDYCVRFPNKRLCNGGCFHPNLNVLGIAQKSGDIMLLDTASFRKIGGWPETIYYNHVDLAVCFVAANNFKIVVINDMDACIYTFTQEKRNEPSFTSVGGAMMSPEQIEKMEFVFACSYANKKKCNI